MATFVISFHESLPRYRIEAMNGRYLSRWFPDTDAAYLEYNKKVFVAFPLSLGTLEAFKVYELRNEEA